MATAKHRAIDLLAPRGGRCERKHERARRASWRSSRRRRPTAEAALDDEVGDDLLRLIFIACHPVLVDRGARRR